VILHFTKRTLHPGTAALEIKGSIHHGPECVRLVQEVDEMIAAKETRVILDMTGVTYADSAAIGAIVKCLTRLKHAGGALRIAGAQTMISHSLKLTKVDTLIEMFPTVDQAAHGFTAPDATAS
jgi:anti-anti-sigma factor